jgi:beta-1,2-mannobiose phosphorylase / 1,2-beta-oligomannan phosphorylase
MGLESKQTMRVKSDSAFGRRKGRPGERLVVSRMALRSQWVAGLLIAGILFGSVTLGKEKVTIVPKLPIVLFDGHDLEAFDVWLGQLGHENKDEVFRLEEKDGAKVLRISGEHWGGLVTKAPFADYVLTFDYAWGNSTSGERQNKARNSGVLLHCQGDFGNYDAGFKSPWMKSVEFEMMEGGTGDIVLVRGYDQRGQVAFPELTGKIDGQSIRWNDMGKEVRFPSDEFKPNGRIWWKDRDSGFEDRLGFRGEKDVERPLGEWNQVRLTCEGGDLTCMLNGIVVNEGTAGSLSSGKIMIQSEGAEIFLRNVRALPLPKRALPNAAELSEFPPELVQFDSNSKRQLFAGTGENTWDRQIRERGWIMREGATWHLWYTGYRETQDIRQLGYATSSDGLNWKRWPDNPLTNHGWVEDMCVVKHGDTYIMFAEGLHDLAHLLTSTDRIHWTEQGRLDIRKVNGKPIADGAYGTPTAWFENGLWWLFYERGDRAVYVARSNDMKVWTNVTDLPVIRRGPEEYDRHAVAIDQIVKYAGRYFAFYHASSFPEWDAWCNCVAVSEDLVQWRKYPGNPILPVDEANPKRSSPTVVHDGQQFRLYTSHPELRVHFPKPASK